MKRFNLKKGFTLIELLVVVAIIGILASVVLASLNSARAKGADAATKANLSNIRAQAELFFDTNNHYGATGQTTVAACPTTGTTIFNTDATIKNAIAAAKNSSGSDPFCGSTPGTTATSWAIHAPLKATAGNWCVDSAGAAKIGSATVS
jgi:prepilin-type N-terminal cleavage/methylation domain-containing protein